MNARSRWSFRIARVAGINVRIHVSFLLLVVLLLPAGPGYSMSLVVTEAVWIATVFACVVLHELSHCVIARRYGIGVRDILLLPIGGLSEMERMPEEPRRELAIAAAGPAASVALAVTAGVGAVALGSAIWPPTLFVGPFLVRLAWLNLLLAGFNLLPALPLDGGRVLRAGLALRWGRPRATSLAVTLGRMAAIGLVLVGVFYDFWLVLIGAFVYLGATAEGAQEAFRLRLVEFTVDQVMTHSPWVIDEREPLSPATAGEACRRHGALPVAADGVYVGVVGLPEVPLIRSGATAGSACRRDLPTLVPSQRLDLAYQVMTDANRPALVVLAGDGAVVGVLSLEQMSQALRPGTLTDTPTTGLERFLGPRARAR